jgi:hypothetical protein
VVDPAPSGAGLGRGLVSLLAAEARRPGYEAVRLRVPADDVAARATPGGGVRLRDRVEEEAFNQGQPRWYVWMPLRGA